MTWEVFISYEHLKSLGIALGIFFLFLLFRKLFTKYIFKMLVRAARKGKTNMIPNVFLAFERPLQWLFILVGVYAAIRYYPYINHADETIIKLLRAFLVFLISWGLINLSSTSSKLFNIINEKTNIKIDEILIPFLSRAIQFIIIAISLSVILQEFDYEIGGFLTGLGLGGLAFSLAAKDVLANLFGGIVIITEKPFTIDDWIMTPSVEGTIEDISFRSTKVRTFSQALVTVPNATLANEPITNWSKMGKRQISFSIRITYDTPRQTVMNTVDTIKALLLNHPGVHPETILVAAEELKEDGIDILIYFYTKTTDWEEHLQIREAINLQILHILEQEGAEIALPSQKLFVDKDKEEQ